MAMTQRGCQGGHGVQRARPGLRQSEQVMVGVSRKVEDGGRRAGDVRKGAGR